MFERSDIAQLLSCRGSDQEHLFADARAVRDEEFGRSVVVRGVVEVTNVCRVDCDYCPMRISNLRMNDRFTLGSDDIMSAAEDVIAQGINVVFFQGGESPASIAAVEHAVAELKKRHRDTIEILLNLGSLGHHNYRRLRDAGADSYILKVETGDPDLHSRTRGEKLDDRLAELQALKDEGFKVGTGIISSLPGQTFDSIVDDMMLLHELDVDMCSVSPFIPAPNTPLSDAGPGDVDLALNIIAVLRLMNRRVLVPSVSALEKLRPGGQTEGLNAGANVVTINFSKGPTRDRYLIYGKDRFVVGTEHANDLIHKAGMVPGGSLLV